MSKRLGVSRARSKHDRSGGNGIRQCVTGFELVQVPSGAKTPVTLPPDACPDTPQWSADGKQFAFPNITANSVQLWVGDAATGKLRQVPGARLNPMFGGEVHWMPDQKTLLVKLIPQGAGTPPAAPLVPEGPSIQESAGKKGQSSTYEKRDALLQEYDHNRHWERTYIVNVDDAQHKPRLLWDLSSEEKYADPGTPRFRRLANGARVIRMDGDSIYQSGAGASPDGARPFFARLDLASLKSERLFRSEADAYEHFLSFSGADVRSFVITLYTPPGYKEGTRVPTILYAYPLDYADPSKAGQVTGSQATFTRLRLHRLLLLAGYAIIDNASFPIVGEPKKAYDTYLEQLVADAKAAVDEAVRMGVADPSRVGVTGHSHGALMTVNLLAHSDLFKAGVASSPRGICVNSYPTGSKFTSRVGLGPHYRRLGHSPVDALIDFSLIAAQGVCGRTWHPLKGVPSDPSAEILRHSGHSTVCANPDTVVHRRAVEPDRDADKRVQVVDLIKNSFWHGLCNVVCIPIECFTHGPTHQPQHPGPTPTHPNRIAGRRHRYFLRGGLGAESRR